ncbi:MAG: adenylate/guanylate cyclase domain-containing protein [Actinomycetota bacterium]|nr:adenylate/guanylate cyclase domain-containing protein [Actinomycetota bacterium]
MAEAPSGTVTLLFSDIEGSTRLLQRTGDAYADLVAEHRRLLREAFERHRGFEVDSEGDAFFVTFASANDAAAAAAEAQQALARHAWPGENEIRVRMGLHTGEPRSIDGRYIGLDVHQAARVMAAGHGGQVLLSEATRALVGERFQLRDLGEHRLKDLSGPQHLYQLQVEGLPTDFPPLNTLENRPTNLPAQPNAFIGRARELQEAEALLTRADVRLLVLTGTGGAGKTRLALQLAATVIEQFPNGVFFVSLAPIRDWELVVPTIAQTLGLREQSGEAVVETLTEYLRDKQMLLVLDNFEQLVAAAPAIAGLLGSARGLTVLVTSRTPLRLSGERTYAVPPLALPDPDRPQDTANLAACESVSLFVERAHAAVAEFAVTDANAQTLAEICVRLDGLPLAIELAASRVRALPPPALLRRLDQRLALLTGGAQDLDERQRTLRATIEWSYDLLLNDEKALFARLGVCVGGCRLEAAEALCDPEGDLGIEIFDGLESLVDKSLLRQKADSDGEPRFWMLETIREYALELLEEAGAIEEARRRHAAYFVSVAERLDLESRTGDQPSFLARLDDDNANLRAAIDWAREARDGDLTLRLASALWGFWATHGHVAEGRRALDDALELSGRRPPRALLGLLTLRMMRGESDGLLADAQEALSACEQLGDDFSLAQAWNLLGRVEGSVMGALGRAERAWRQGLSYAEHGDYAAERAESIGWLMISAIFGPLPVDEGIARCNEFFETAGDDPAIRAFCCVELAVLEAMSGEFARARELLADGTRAIAELGLNVWAANNAQEAFFVEMLAGSPDAAASTLRGSYTTLEQMGERGFLSTIAGFLAHALYAQGEYGEAERFSRASEAAAAPDDVLSQVLWRAARAKVRAQRGDAEGAETLAREAVRLAEGTDLLNTQGDALLDLATVLTAGGRREEALAAAEGAAKRYEQKGNRPSLERAREVERELAAPLSSG